MSSSTISKTGELKYNSPNNKLFTFASFFEFYPKNENVYVNNNSEEFNKILKAFIYKFSKFSTHIQLEHFALLPYNNPQVLVVFGRIEKKNFSLLTPQVCSFIKTKLQENFPEHRIIDGHFDKNPTKNKRGLRSLRGVLFQCRKKNYDLTPKIIYGDPLEYEKERQKAIQNKKIQKTSAQINPKIFSNFNKKTLESDLKFFSEELTANDLSELLINLNEKIILKLALIGLSYFFLKNQNSNSTD